MENEISRQLTQALFSLALGVGAGLVYDALRAARERLRHPVFTFFADLLFGFLCGAALFFCGLTAGQGRQRIFMVVIALLGGAVYFNTLSRFALAFFRILAAAVSFFVRILTFPLVFLLKFLKKVNIFLKKYFQNKKNRYKIKYQNVTNTGRGSRGRKRGNLCHEAETNGTDDEDSSDSAYSLCNHRSYRPALQHREIQSRGGSSAAGGHR
ncbi:MAG: spore cortex biosynthesis protein YabQ [Oscillospiraceae bacterium]|nr:spore cortex biosynthesis protein YabQ [Oscillospiraceae bacterium]